MARETLHLSSEEVNWRRFGAQKNKLHPEDRAAHDWYRFVLSFPPHLVRNYIERFSINGNHLILDPFCGTGTTIDECKKLGIPSVGIEAHPMAYFASKVKTDWSPDPDALIEHAYSVSEAALAELEASGIEDDPLPLFQMNRNDSDYLRDLPDESRKLLLNNSISPLPLHKTLVLIEQLNRRFDSRYYDHEMVALAKALVHSISNLHFGPEVGVRFGKQDAPVVAAWLSGIHAMADDLRKLQVVGGARSAIYQADSRDMTNQVEPCSVDAVITSPPYPNEKDYTRATRLESVILGFIRNKAELQALKRSLLRSNTRNVYKADDDDKWVSSHAEIQRISEAIEARRIMLKKTSGFEKLYARVAKLYFGAITRHLAELRRVLRPNAHLAYVVGDQASYLRIMIRTGELFASIAQSLGYELINIDLFRTRIATATKELLREEVVILRWPGNAAANPIKVKEGAQ